MVELTAVAYSYGTQVALLYAERFPSATRAMVLDGVVDIDEAKDSFTVALNQSLGYQNTFVRFARWCAKTRSCPLSAESEVATRQYQHLLRQLHEQPLHTAEGRTVSASELISLTTGLLLWRSSWPELATAVRQLDQGIVSLEVSRLLDYATSFGDPDALNVISCVDQSVPAQNQGEILRQKEQIREAFAATNYLPQKTDTPDLCDLWPWRSNVMNKRPQHVPILPPLLFVAQRYDPTTPWENARAMASKFRSPLLTREGDGHTLALSGLSVCVDKMVVSYLINPDKKHKDRVCY